MHSRKLRTALLGGGLFIAGWAAGEMTGGAQAQGEPRMDPQIAALIVGMASVAVDTEATAIRMNEPADRLAALQRRVAQLETQGKR